MGAIPGDLDTDQQPPMTVPLRHFVVSFVFLALGILVGFGVLADTVPGLGNLAHIHLLLAGWICITIMGAMTQFIPVWSGTTLHSRQLATLQLALVVTGLLGFAFSLTIGKLVWLAPFGLLMLAGFWTFAYNITRTLLTLERYDVTERHFALALLFLVLLTFMGIILAIDFTYPVLPLLSVGHAQLLATHATLAVFGVILTTVYGALYQLGTMFTQTELHGIDHYLKSAETIGHPTGVLLLAGGRLTDWVLPARIGAVLILIAALAFSVVLGRKLFEMEVERTPMHSRYAVVPLALAAWAILSLPAWLTNPLAGIHRFGGPGVAHLLLLGGIGFVVFGTIYHIVPFIIWVHRYADLLGLEDVPMIDDLYDDRLATIDFGLLSVGTGLLVGAKLFTLPTVITVASGIFIGVGILVFVTNMLLVLKQHGPHSLGQLLLGSLNPRPTATDVDSDKEPSAPDQ